MPEFLSLCACRGAKPRNLKAQKTHARDHLVTKLMSQRNVLRYVCAPKGFGKSILASQYAELVFSFKDVFWINCQSPCFIRDLDSRELLNELFELCQKPKLVVFDDYENIDDSRAVKFSNLINVLLEKSVEVIVISSPDNDGFLQGHPDCLTLTANDLLLGEQECANSSENIINRIPVVAWNSEYPIVELLKCAISENLPDAVKFALFYEYLNGSGSVKLLEKYLSKSEVKLLKELDEKYLFFGLSSDANEFTVPDINFSKLISVFAAYSSSFQNITKTKNKSKFLEQIINDLEEKNKNKKIIEVAICSAVNSLRLSCFNKYKDWLIENFELSLLIKLYKKLHLSDSNLGTESIYYAFSMGVLGHTKEAIKVAFNVLDNDFSTIENKLLSALIFMRYGSDNEKLRALKLIRYIYDDFKIDNYLDNKNLSDNVKDEFKLISNLININLAIFHETKDPFGLWLDQVEQKVSNRDLLCAENIFALHRYINKSFFAGESYLKFIQILSKTFKDKKLPKSNFCSYLFMNSYKFFESDNSLSEDLPRIYFDNKANDGYESFINKINKEILILSQSFNPANNSISLDSITNDDLVDELTSTDSSVPILQINIFGGLTVKFGDNDVISTSIGRQHIKALIAILVIANGNEVSKDRLSELIWPESNSYSRKASMNSLWYQLRTILSLNDGRCPYLIKNQNSYKILKKYVHSDLDTLEHICADLTLGGIDSQIWWEKIENNEGIFNGDLLPSETSNSYILKKRKEFNMKITDSLVAAANRLIDADQIPQALWFARKALSKDDKREDVYITLMKAQLKAGQRTPAIETYFACKNFLEEIHGIAPSSELNFMYKQVVNGDTNTKKLA